MLTRVQEKVGNLRHNTSELARFLLQWSTKRSIYPNKPADHIAVLWRATWGSDPSLAHEVLNASLHSSSSDLHPSSLIRSITQAALCDEEPEMALQALRSFVVICCQSSKNQTDLQGHVLRGLLDIAKSLAIADLAAVILGNEPWNPDIVDLVVGASLVHNDNARTFNASPRAKLHALRLATEDFIGQHITVPTPLSHTQWATTLPLTTFLDEIAANPLNMPSWQWCANPSAHIHCAKADKQLLWMCSVFARHDIPASHWACFDRAVEMIEQLRGVVDDSVRAWISRSRIAAQLPLSPHQPPARRL